MNDNTNLLLILAVAIIAPITTDLIPRVRLPGVVLEITIANSFSDARERGRAGAGDTQGIGAGFDAGRASTDPAPASTAGRPTRKPK